jgi:hypothetical protein
MMRVMKSSGVAVLFAGSVVAGFWLGGFDLNERGGVALACYLSSLAAAAYGFGFTMMVTEGK